MKFLAFVHTVLLLLISSLKIHAIQDFEGYSKFLKDYPLINSIGNYKEGEIQILTDLEMIQKAEQKTKREVGIVFQDKYWKWVNDAVQFPDGSIGVYGRIIWNSGLDGTPGIIVIPVFPDGRIALNCNYRHATRSWELELPRGALNSNETHVDAAKREVREETGLTITDVTLLGYMNPESGLTMSVAPIYQATISSMGLSQNDESEAIHGIMVFTRNELNQLIGQGKTTLMIHGQNKEVFVRDPFLTFALYQMDLKNSSN